MTYAAISVGANTSLPVVITGGTLSSDSTYYYRTFTGNGTLSVQNASAAVEFVIISGGGSGSAFDGPNGGSAGFLTASSQTVQPGNYNVVVGAGGSYSSGSASSFNSNTSAGGFVGASGSWGAGSGGLGLGGTGVANSGNYGGAGGVGTSSYSAWASATSTGSGGKYGGGGGGGSSRLQYAAAGGAGGGGAGGWSKDWNTYVDGVSDVGKPGTDNTGSGGGGPGTGLVNGGQNYTGPGNGGSGIVMIRYLKSVVGG